MKTEKLVKHVEKDHGFVLDEAQDLLSLITPSKAEAKAALAYNDCKQQVFNSLSTGILNIVIAEMGKRTKFFNIDRLLKIGIAAVKLIKETIDLNKACQAGLG